VSSRSARPTSFAKTPPRVLVVDDDAAIRRMVERVLGTLGCVVIGAEDGAEARKICAERPDVQLGIVDITLPDADGQVLVGELRDLLGDKAPPFILFSGRPPDGPAPEGVVAILPKPVGIGELLAVVKRAIPPRSRTGRRSR